MNRRKFIKLLGKVGLASGVVATSGVAAATELSDVPEENYIDAAFDYSHVARWDGAGNSWSSEDGGKSWKQVGKAPAFDNPDAPFPFFLKDEDDVLTVM